MNDQKRRYERIETELPCRLFIPDDRKKESLKFEAFTVSENLGLGGVFVKSTFLLKPGVKLWIELRLPEEALAIRAQVVHVIPLDQPNFSSGMGIEFQDVDSHGRETLLRYFTPARYHAFYEAMVAEFPHLKKVFQIQDASFTLNLWEEWKIRQAGGPAATESGVPEPTPRPTGRR